MRPDEPDQDWLYQRLERLHAEFRKLLRFPNPHDPPHKPHADPDASAPPDPRAQILANVRAAQAKALVAYHHALDACERARQARDRARRARGESGPRTEDEPGVGGVGDGGSGGGGGDPST